MIEPPDGITGRGITGRTWLYVAAIVLAPGLSLKRWLLLGAVGLLALGAGTVFALDIPKGSAIVSFLSLGGESTWVSVTVFIGAGVALACVAVAGLTRSLIGIRRRSRHGNLLDSLYIQRMLGPGPRIVMIGGGSGMPGLLRGIKEYTSNITAVVTMADDGGSSGRLRDELGIQPPGDIRNCLVALADSEPVMQQLMDYRFSSNGDLDGHSFGNMFIAALAGIGGDFYRGVEVASELLAVRGRVVPSTTTDVTLVGNTAAGEVLVGETMIAGASDRLRSVSMIPPDPAAHPEAVKAIREADIIVIGPGSLFTSIVPNLLIRDITGAITGSKAYKIYVCNVAEEPRQTVGFSVQDHVAVVRHYGGPDCVDAVVANTNIPPGPTPAGLSFIRPQQTWDDPAAITYGDVIDEASTARHHFQKLARAVAETYGKRRAKRRWLPWTAWDEPLATTAARPALEDEAPNLAPGRSQVPAGRP